jgi:hypothetical protein
LFFFKSTFRYKKFKKSYFKTFWEGNKKRSYLEDVTLKYDPNGNTEMDNDIRVYLNAYNVPVGQSPMEIKGIDLRPSKNLRNAREIELNEDSMLIIKDVPALCQILALARKYNKAFPYMNIKLKKVDLVKKEERNFVTDFKMYNKYKLKIAQIKGTPEESKFYAYYKAKKICKFLYWLVDLDPLIDFFQNNVALAQMDAKEDGEVISTIKTILNMALASLVVPIHLMLNLAACLVDLVLTSASLLVGPLIKLYDEKLVCPLLERGIAPLGRSIEWNSVYFINCDFDRQTESAAFREREDRRRWQERLDAEQQGGQQRNLGFNN